MKPPQPSKAMVCMRLKLAKSAATPFPGLRRDVYRFLRVDRDVRRLKSISGALLAAAGLAWLIACLWFPLTDTDIWWHLASAKLMWTDMTFLRRDPFCQSSLGAPWADLHWGFQILAYAAWKTGGAGALVAGKCMALAGALGFALRPHLDRRTLPWLVPLAAFGLYHVRFFIDVRPLAFTLLCLGIQYWAVAAHFRGGLRWPWAILIPAQVVLVNLQGLYPLGALLVSFLLAGEYAGRRRPSLFATWFAPAIADPIAKAEPMSKAGTIPSLRPLAFTCAALWGCGLISPYGWHGFTLPLSLLGRITPVASNIFSSEIAENLPLSDLLRRDPGAALPFLVFGLAVVLSFLGKSARISLGHALLFLGFAALGWMAQRNLPLSVLAGLMAAGHNLQVSLGEADRARSPGAAGAKGADESLGGLSSRLGRTGRAGQFGWAALLAIVALYGPRIRSAWAYELPGSLQTPFRFPAPAVDFLERNPLRGPIFNELRYGGYLEFRLYPPKTAFVDGRMILRSAEFYREFLEAVDHPDRFPAYRARYGFTHALLPISEDPRFVPLAAYLLESLGWKLLYCDGASALLADDTILDGSAAAMELDSLPAGHPLPVSVHNRFAANPRLESMAIRNAARFLRSAGRGRAAADLAGP